MQSKSQTAPHYQYALVGRHQVHQQFLVRRLHVYSLGEGLINMGMIG